MEAGSKEKEEKLRCKVSGVGSTPRVSRKELKCPYTNIQNLGNKQCELEILVQDNKYDIVNITET